VSGANKSLLLEEMEKQSLNQGGQTERLEHLHSPQNKEGGTTHGEKFARHLNDYAIEGT